MVVEAPPVPLRITSPIRASSAIGFGQRDGELEIAVVAGSVNARAFAP